MARIATRRARIARDIGHIRRQLVGEPQAIRHAKALEPDIRSLKPFQPFMVVRGCAEQPHVAAGSAPQEGDDGLALAGILDHGRTLRRDLAPEGIGIATGCQRGDARAEIFRRGRVLVGGRNRLIQCHPDAACLRGGQLQKRRVLFGHGMKADAAAPVMRQAAQMAALRIQQIGIDGQGARLDPPGQIAAGGRLDRQAQGRACGQFNRFDRTRNQRVLRQHRTSQHDQQQGQPYHV
ncbi:hypothetical protein LO749_06655 [Paracoccus denitrificans]|nr:hypothetical protein [Paracoccus denitrificans]UFS63862.1 hypothetical protein LO749_06655 [Paracoccus denitrificans]